MDILISIIVCFLSVYGFFQLLYSFACRRVHPPKKDSSKTHRVVIVEDDSLWLEGYIRSLSLNDDFQRMFIIDNSESDEMAEMLGILNAEFDFVEVVSLQEYIYYMNLYKEINFKKTYL